MYQFLQPPFVQTGARTSSIASLPDTKIGLPVALSSKIVLLLVWPLGMRAN